MIRRRMIPFPPYILITDGATLDKIHGNLAVNADVCFGSVADGLILKLASNMKYLFSQKGYATYIGQYIIYYFKSNSTNFIEPKYKPSSRPLAVSKASRGLSFVSTSMLSRPSPSSLSTLNLVELLRIKVLPT